MKGVLNVTSIPGGIKVSGTDPDVNMDDLADAMWEGFLRSEERLRAEGRSHFRTKEDEAMNDRALTFGEKAVGLTFNLSGDEMVATLKQLYAQIIDLCHAQRAGSQGERARLWSIAITEAQGAQMWAVKSAMWRDE